MSMTAGRSAPCWEPQLRLPNVMSRNAPRSLAREARTFLRLRCRSLRGRLIRAHHGDEFFELQFQLLYQPRRALGTLPVQFAFELLDPKLEMRDQRLVVRQLRPRVGGIRDGHIAFSLQRLTLGQQRHVGIREGPKEERTASTSSSH